MENARRTVSVIMTVKNDAEGCAVTLESLLGQTRAPDEIIIVDGGSTDATTETIRGYVTRHAHIRLIEAPGVNIARGRNLAVGAAGGEIIAGTDCGCRAEPTWLENLLAPFERERHVEFVAGFYQVDACTLMEHVVGLATMRGQLDPVCPKTFNPSARSMACTKALWSRAGGWPEWLFFSEDTLFDHKIRRMNAEWRFAGDAIVHWRPRSTLLAIAKQFYGYGTGRGHTQIGAGDFAYNLRNVFLVGGALAMCVVTPWALAFVVALLAYFYVWTFHRKALRVAGRVGRPSAYPLCLIVLWVVLTSNLIGYLVGSWARWRDRDRFQESMDAYLANS